LWCAGDRPRLTPRRVRAAAGQPTARAPPACRPNRGGAPAGPHDTDGGPAWRPRSTRGGRTTTRGATGWRPAAVARRPTDARVTRGVPTERRVMQWAAASRRPTRGLWTSRPPPPPSAPAATRLGAASGVPRRGGAPRRPSGGGEIGSVGANRHRRGGAVEPGRPAAAPPAGP